MKTTHSGVPPDEEGVRALCQALPDEWNVREGIIMAQLCAGLVGFDVVAQKPGDHWPIALLKNTPAQFRGRPEITGAPTEELRQPL